MILPGPAFSEGTMGCKAQACLEWERGVRLAACDSLSQVMGAEHDMGMAGARSHETPGQHLLGAQGARRSMEGVGCQLKCLLMEKLGAALPLKWGGLTGTAFAGLGLGVSREIFLTWMWFH